MASCRWISSRVVAIVNNPTHRAVIMINTAVAVLFTAILVATRSSRLLGQERCVPPPGQVQDSRCLGCH